MVRAQTVVAVLATGALLGAGGAFAANKLVVKGGNVVDGSLTGKDIKNGSIQQVDLSSFLRSKIARIGSGGTTGAQGAAGAQGPPGPQGPPGITAAASSKQTTTKPLGTTPVELIAQDTATGGYTGVATVQVAGSGAGATVTCTLTIGANSSAGSATVGNGDKVTIPVVAAGVLDTPGKITLACTADSANASATGATLVVTRIQNVTTDGY